MRSPSGLDNNLSIIHGDKTFKAVMHSISKIKKQIKHTETYEVKNAGHLPIEDQPEMVAKFIFNKNE